MMNDTERNKRFNKERSKQLKLLLTHKQALWDELIRLLELAEEKTQTILQAQPTDWQQWHYGKLQGQLSQVLVDLGQRTAEQINVFSKSTWQAGINLIDAPLKAGGVTVNGFTQLINHKQLLAIDTFMTERIKNVLQGKDDDIKRELGLVMIGAQDVYTARDNIRNSLTEGEMHRAKTIVNTELGRLYNRAGFLRLQEIADAVPGMQKEWRMGRRKEHRTTHLAVRNTTKPVNEPFKVGGVLMMHPHDPSAGAKETVNCSCFLVPTMSDWKVNPNLATKV